MVKNKLLKNKLNKNIDVNIKHLRKTNRPLTKNPSARKPGKKTTHTTRHLC